MGKANAFTAPITVVNYDEQALNNTEARTLVDAVAKKDASVWQFGGESNTLTGLYFRGYQLDARQFSVNGLAGMYGTQGTASVQVGSAQLIKGASTAVNGMDPEGAVSGSVNIETKKAADEGNRKIGLGRFSNNRAQGTFDLGQRFGENKAFGVRANGKLRHGDTPRHGYSEDNKEFAVNADYRGETLRVAFDSIYAKPTAVARVCRTFKTPADACLARPMVKPTCCLLGTGKIPPAKPICLRLNGMRLIMHRLQAVSATTRHAITAR